MKRMVPIVILLFVFIVALGVVIGIAIGNSGRQTENAGTEQTDDENVEKWQEGMVSYNGKNYLYNQNISTYLFMGIDVSGPVASAENYAKGGQSDAMFLLVVNDKEETISVVSIHRNTMTKIAICDIYGTSMGEETAQICLQHAYGDGKRLSCSRTVDAVSNLFYNIPIDGYLSMRMDGMTILNNSVGGVELEVLYDVNMSSKNVSLKQGDVVTLTDDEAYAYLRYRDIEEYDSASRRLERQEQYMTAYVEKVKKVTGGDVNAALGIYEKLEDYIVTNLDFADLAEDLLNYGYSSDRVYSIPGQVQMGEMYEEYYVDEDALYEMIIDLFYEEVEEE